MSDLFPFLSKDPDDDICEEGGGTIIDPCKGDPDLRSGEDVYGCCDIDQSECDDDEIVEPGEPNSYEIDSAVERLEYIFDKAGLLASIFNNGDELFLED